MDLSGFIKRTASFLVTAAICLTFVTASFATDGYEKLFGIPTESTAGWHSVSSTTVSENMIRHDDRPAVSFTSELDTVSGNYVFTVIWDEFGSDISQAVLNIDFFLSDITALLRNDGTMYQGYFSLMSDEGYGFKWRISDLPLKTGWNSVALNIRTAEKVFPETADVSETQENADEQSDTQDETNEKTEERLLTAEEFLPLINRFSFEFGKTTSKAVTVAFSEISVSVIARAEPPEEPDPLTDTIDSGLMTAAIVISVLLIAGVIIYSAVYSKKEIDRRKHEARLRRQEKHKNDQND